MNLGSRSMSKNLILRRLSRFQRRFYLSSPPSHPSLLRRNANILPYTFIAICCAGCAFSNYAVAYEPSYLEPINKHAVCSLQNVREGRYYTLLTSSFTHFNPIHLLMNMAGLQSFGPSVVSIFGPGAFLVLWVGGSLACDTASLYWDWLAQQASRAGAVEGWRQILRRPGAIVENRGVGASGSLLAMFAAFVCMLPNAKVTLFPLPVPLRAWIAIGSFAAGSAYCAVNALLPYIGHAGHLGGMAFGAGWYYIWGRRVLRRFGRF